MTTQRCRYSMGVKIPSKSPLLMNYVCTVADDSDEESAVVRKEKRVAWGKVIQKTSSKTHEKASGSLSSFIFLRICAVQFWHYFTVQLVGVLVTAIVRMMRLIGAK